MKCLQCGEEIFLPHAGQKFCSKKCCNAYHQKEKRILDDRQCEFCGETFTPYWRSQTFCRRCKELLKTNPKRPPSQKKSDKTLEEWVREARECNLDYGNYRALIAAGKTYEELKATADTRTAVKHAHKPSRFI